MTKAMLRGCGAVCLVVFAAVFVGATPIAHNVSDDGDCVFALGACALATLSPYIGLNETELLAKIRNTPLYQQCRDYKLAADCVREELNGSSCDGISSNLSSTIATGLKVYEFASKYICAEHYYDVAYYIPCLANDKLVDDIESRCNFTSSDPNKICESVHKKNGCTEAKIRTQCDRGAAILYKDFNVKLLDKFSKFLYDKDCSYKPTNQLELMRRLLSGE